jgi:iron complex transport system permease protein
LLFAVIILIAFSIYSLMVGSVPLSLAQVEQYFLGHATATQTIILSDIRIPRTVIAIVAGAALSLSGLLLQTVTRNSLSCPTILGVGQGSALTALIILLCVPTIELNTYFLLVIFGGLVLFLLVEQ